MTQLLTAASIIKSSAVQNLHTYGPVDAVTTPGRAFEMEWFAATPTTCADFKEPCVWNMSLKTSEEDRLEDLGSPEKLQITAYFPFVSDDSAHGEMMGCDSPLAL